MPKMTISATGIPWFARQDYRRVLKIMVDADDMFGRYDDWLKAAEEIERKIKAEGCVAVRAEIDPKTFPEWCRSRALDIDARARAEFAVEVARKKLAIRMN